MGKKIDAELSCCRVEAVVSVDSRGQLLLPKNIREQAGIIPGDKLAVVVMRKGSETCCLSLMKVDALAGMVRELLGPMMGQIVQKEA